MCGVAGYASRQRPIGPVAFERSLDAMHHRGPDGRGAWFGCDGRIALGHTRLAIVDPDGGRQPLSNERGDVHAVVNGEFYDDVRIRRDLEARGHRFSTRSDSELLVHLYEDEGIRCVHSLRGEFAAVLWDARNRLLFAVRDRFGVKPLVYADDGQRLALASEAKALFAMGEVQPRWDDHSVHTALATQYVPPDRTWFDGVRMLEPGHLLTWSDGQTRIKKYWDLYQQPLGSDPRPLPELEEEFEHRFRESVRLRLRADVPVAFTLSGGVDSSAVAGFARELGTATDYYTVTFDETIDRESYDEGHLAQATADHLGGTLRRVNVSRHQLLDALPDAVWFSEGSAINAHLPAKYLLSKQAHEDGYRVLITGEGSDELLLGYPHLRTDHLSEIGRTEIIEEVRRAHTVSMGVMLPDGDALDVGGLERRLGHVPSWVRAKSTYAARMAPLVASDFASAHQDVDRYALLADLLPDDPARPLPRVYDSAYLWTRLCLANYILKVLGDGTEMANSIEGRVPFLDHELAEFLFRAPLTALMGEGQEKQLLRAVCRGRVIDEVRRRDKHPFLTPFLYTPEDPRLRDWFGDLVDTACPAFIDRDRARSMLDQAPDPRTDPVFLTLACLCLLQAQLIDRSHS